LVEKVHLLLLSKKYVILNDLLKYFYLF